MSASSIQNSLVYSGHEYAIIAARGRLDALSQISEEWNGVTQAEHVLGAAAKEDLGGVCEKIHAIASWIRENGMFRVGVVSERPEEHSTRLCDVASGLGAGVYVEELAVGGDLPPPEKNHFVPVHAGVNFVA